MSRSAPPLAPLFRSDTQLDVLGVLFVLTDRPLTVSELARRLGRNRATVSREVNRLGEHEYVTITEVGRTHLVAANYDLPWYAELRSLLAQTIGPAGLLAAGMAEVAGVESAYIYGSWADRFHGTPGPFPRDIDVLVVGASPDVAAVRAVCRDVEKQLKIDVNPTIISPSQWDDADDGFVATVRSRPLVPLVR